MFEPRTFSPIRRNIRPGLSSALSLARLALSLLGGCTTNATDNAGSDPSAVHALDSDQQPGGAHGPDPFTLVARVRGVQMEGDLCPPTQTMTFEASSGSFVAKMGQKLYGPLRASCRMTLDFSIPADYTLKDPKIQYQALASGVTLTTAYEFPAGKTKFGPTSHSWSEARTALMDSTSQIWASECDDAAQRYSAPFIIDFSVAIEEDGWLDGITLDLSSSFIDRRMSWVYCPTNGVALPQPAAGAKCGPNQHGQCLGNLRCDFADDERNTAFELDNGVCVDPTESLPRQSLGDWCGGSRMVQCDDKLYCHYSSQARQRSDVRGRCRNKISQRGEICGGVPDLPCADDLRCAASPVREENVKRCEIVTDESTTRKCGPGLPECEQGSGCYDGICDTKVVKRGDPCDANHGLVCIYRDICDADTKRCVELPSAGENGTKCANDEDCHQGLTCRKNACVPLPNGALDAPCGSLRDCADGLVCRRSDDASSPKLTCRAPAPFNPESYCEYNADCGGGLVCRNRLCLFDGTGSEWSTCDRSRPCDDTLTCVDGICRAASRQ